MHCAHDIAKAIRTYRERTGITLRELSERTGMGISQLNNYELGKVLRVQFKTIAKLRAAGILAESTDPR